MFAFINNDNEAQRVVYTQEEQMKVGKSFAAKERTSEAGLRHTNPDWEQRMAKWEESVKDNSARMEWFCGPDSFEDISNRWTKIPARNRMVRFLAQGYAANQYIP